MTGTNDKCDGCIWYRGYFPKVRCLNITMIDRGGWNPIPPGRCKEYDDGKKKAGDTAAAETVSGDPGHKVRRGSVQKSGPARDLHPNAKGKKVQGSGRRGGSGD